MSPNGIRLLCVDDDPAALEDIRAAAARVGVPFSAGYFGSPGKALAAQCAEPADIVISDLRLGSTTGLRLIADMQSVAPASVYMLISGEADLDSALCAMNEARVFRFLTKPVDAEAFARALVCAVGEIERRKAAAAAQSSLAAVDRLSVAIAVLDGDFRLLQTNAQAEAILRESGVFEIARDGELRMRSSRETRGLHEFLSKLGRGGATTGGGIFRIRRRDRAAPVVVSAARCPDGSGGDSLFSLVISDPSRRVFSSEHALAVALDLTPSEARVVFGLTEGSSLRDAARRAGVSVSTARTYLKNVFSKTGVTRQAELVRLAILSAA